MIIYRVYSTENHLEFAPTMGAARDVRKRLVSCGADAESISIERVTVAPTRAGIASELNAAIALTCFNEG